MANADWDLSDYFPGAESDAYSSFVAALRDDLTRLAAEVGDESGLVELIVSIEDADQRLAHLDAYLACAGAADSTDEVIARESAAFSELAAAQEKLHGQVRAALGAMSDDDFERLVGDPKINAGAYHLGRLRAQAQRSMDSKLEGLAADLGVNGLSAWGRLYSQISGKLSFELEVEGASPETLPVSMTRSLLENESEAVRRAALRGSNQAWERVSDTLAACLNGIAGTRLTLYKRRGIEHFLEPALFDAGIRRETLDAMMQVAEERQSVGQTYLEYKAKLLGKESLAWHDLSAPAPTEEKRPISWDDARELVVKAFSESYPALGDFAESAFAGKWIDHSPRPGKRPGGFCAPSHRVGQSRIFMTYGETAGDVMTLAHELGHAFHSHMIRDMRYWETNYPMTLAETASTFAEQVVTEALLGDEKATDKERLGVLDRKLADAATFLMNIPARFYFESSLYQERQSGELSVSRLKELMLEAERRAYGKALDPKELDPWFWASKLHFYITEISFYNFPYTFGYLFSLGLFARAKEEGAAFHEKYEALLRATGSKPAEDVAKDALGVDITKPDFWNASVDLIEADLNRYVEAFTWGQV